MKLDWESDNMAWGIYISLNWRAFYFCIVLAGIDFEFHIHNLRDVFYEETQSSAPTANEEIE